MRHRAWNLAHIYLGQPGTGKTTGKLAQAMSLSRCAYVIASDPTGSYSDPGTQRHAGVRPSDVHRYESLAELEKGLREHPRGIHCLDVADGMVVLRAALQVAAASLRAGGGVRGVPVVVDFDEVVAVSGMNASYIDPAFQEAYLLRRHRHLGFLLSTQRATAIHPTIWDNATHLTMYRINRRMFPRLEDLGVPAATLAEVERLPNFKSITHWFV